MADPSQVGNELERALGELERSLAAFDVLQPLLEEIAIEIGLDPAQDGSAPPELKESRDHLAKKLSSSCGRERPLLDVVRDLLQTSAKFRMRARWFIEEKKGRGAADAAFFPREASSSRMTASQGESASSDAVVPLLPPPPPPSAEEELLYKAYGKAKQVLRKATIDPSALVEEYPEMYSRDRVAEDMAWSERVQFFTSVSWDDLKDFLDSRTGKVRRVDRLRRKLFEKIDGIARHLPKKPVRNLSKMRQKLPPLDS